MLTKRGKRILETGGDEDVGILSKKFRRQAESEDENICSNHELGERRARESMDTYDFSGFARDNLDMDYLSDSTDENSGDIPSENVGGFYRPSQNSLSSGNSAKYVNSGMNTLETGNIRLGQSCPMDCHPSGSSIIAKASHRLHNCQYCTTRKKSQKRKVNVSRQSSKRSLKSSTSRSKKNMFSRISNGTRSESKRPSRLHFCQFCAGGGKFSRRSTNLSRQASRRSLKSRSSRRSMKSKASRRNLKSRSSRRSLKSRSSRRSLKSRSSRRSLKSRSSRRSLKSRSSRRSLKSKTSRKSFKYKMSRKSLPKIRLSSTGRASRNITLSRSRTSMKSRCKKRTSSTGSKCKVGKKKGDYSLPREIFNRLVSYYQNSNSTTAEFFAA
ncbi:hypothetical protein GE061_008357 [Apolygus lucorum]|uniref:Uncharacterized protein n=1 Tax=Apolygus lucorum TaxID=248454 RepID=A0A8S9WT80_APOLU|nr:hypothetical protein GE061_008357 [Apolygus lucorum]